jgi:hypothetical protein
MRARLGRNARAFVERELSDHEVITATIALYNRVAGKWWPSISSSKPPTPTQTCAE